MRKVELKKSRDGSHTLYLPELNETYHSIHGAINESKHVFLKMGLNAVGLNTINILEIGFGTGLNAFLTMLEAIKSGKQKIYYHTLEPYPLEENVYKQLNYPAIISSEHESLFLELHQVDWDITHQIAPDFSFHKSIKRLENIDLDATIDIIYFDAFAPNKQPELWEVEALKNCFKALKPGGILVTYCSQGQFKRNLKTVGFEVEKLEGPPGKREMTRGIKPLVQV